MLTEKKALKIYPFIFWPLLFFSLTILYWPSFSNFLFGDDFYLGILGRATSLKEFMNFFNIFRPRLDFPFYRPLSFEVYYWISFSLFKLNPIGYHLTIYLFFLVSLLLVFTLTRKLFKDLFFSYLTTFFYAFSNSHFYRLYFITLCQEVMLAGWYFSSIFFYLQYKEEKKIKYYLISFLFFLLALVTKESALTLPLVIIIIDFYFIRRAKSLIGWFKKCLFTLLPMFLISVFYVFFRLFFFGIAKTNEYQFVFKIKAVLNNLAWYFLWSLGIPEDFVNIRIKDPIYVINPGFFTEFGRGGAVTAVLFIIFAVLLIISGKFILEGLREKKNKDWFRKISFGALWFLLTICLVAFFPFHKFSYSVTLPLYGTALFLSLLAQRMFKFSKSFFFLTLLVYLLANTTANRFAFYNHWVVRRAKISQNIWQNMELYYPNLKGNSKIYFYDYNYCTPISKKQHLLSQETANVLGDESGLNFFYNTTNIKSYYQYKVSLEDLNRQGISNKDLIFIPVGQFFKSEAEDE